jgi:hypothetical protein
MYLSEVEMHYSTQHNPKGGVSPLRYDLAVQNHLECQKKRMRSTSKGKRRSGIDWVSLIFARLYSGLHIRGGMNLVNH